MTGGKRPSRRNMEVTTEVAIQEFKRNTDCARHCISCGTEYDGPVVVNCKCGREFDLNAEEYFFSKDGKAYEITDDPYDSTDLSLGGAFACDCSNVFLKWNFGSGNCSGCDHFLNKELDS
jgi:hypothetical protein